MNETRMDVDDTMEKVHMTAHNHLKQMNGKRYSLRPVESRMLFRNFPNAEVSYSCPGSSFVFLFILKPHTLHCSKV